MTMAARAMVQTGISKALADGTYLRLDTTNDPLTGDLAIAKTAPTITFTDLGGATLDDDWSIGTSGNDFVITNLDSQTTGFLVLDHIVNLRPNPPNPIGAGTQAIRMQIGTSGVPVVGANIGGYFFLNDSSFFDLTGLFSSYGCISLTATVREIGGLATTDACYLFVNNMTVTGATGSSVPAVHSFDHRVQLTASTANNPTGPCLGSWALQDWSNVVASGFGSITVAEMGLITNRPFSFAGTNFFGVLRATGVTASVTVTNRYGAFFTNIIKDGAGGTETLVNDYGMYIEGLNVADTISCGIWIEAAASSTNIYGIVLDGDTVGAGIWFGDGQDAVMFYDGSSLYLDLTYVAPSDFGIECGANKTVELINTVIEDMRVPLIRGLVGGTNPPTLAQFMDNGAGSVGVFAWAFSHQALPADEEQMFLAIQMSHKYKEGTDIVVHIHWTPRVAGAANEFVKWGFEYTWQDVDGTFGNTTIITSDASTPATATTSGDTTLVVDKHYVTLIGTISGTGRDISSMLICRVFRNSSHADDDLIQDAFAFELDLHFEVNTMGSRYAFSK